MNEESLARVGPQKHRRKKNSDIVELGYNVIE
jgi:hypothetical protein